MKTLHHFYRHTLPCPDTEVYMDHLLENGRALGGLTEQCGDGCWPAWSRGKGWGQGDGDGWGEQYIGNGQGCGDGGYDPRMSTGDGGEFEEEEKNCGAGKDGDVNNTSQPNGGYALWNDAAS